MIIDLGANRFCRFSLRTLLALVTMVALGLVAFQRISQFQMEREMLANTTAQLEDDILSYQWLHAMAWERQPNGSPGQHCELIRRTIHKLVKQDAIVIGPMSSGSTIRPWVGSKEDLLRRVDTEIAEMGAPTDDSEWFRFWIGLPSCAMD